MEFLAQPYSLVLIEGSPNETRSRFTELQKMTLNRGMQINKTKKEYMVIGWQETRLLYLSPNLENHFQKNQVPNHII